MWPLGLVKISLMKLLQSGHYIMTSTVVTAAAAVSVAAATGITDLNPEADTKS